MGKGKRGKGEKVKIWLTPSKHASKLHTSLSLSTYSLFPYYLLLNPLLPTTYLLTTYFLSPYYLLLKSTISQTEFTRHITPLSPWRGVGGEARNKKSPQHKAVGTNHKL